MLPEALSNDACSLVPHQDRLAVTVELDFQRRRGGPQRVPPLADPLRRAPGLPAGRPRVRRRRARRRSRGRAPLAVAREVAAALAERRAARGALAVESVEPEFDFSHEGHVTGLDPTEQTESHRLIEHLMIAANEAVATLLETRKLPALYRVHERPEPARVERLVEQLAALDVPTPPLPETMTPQQAGDAGRRAVAARRRARAPHRPRPRRVHLARAALAQAGALRAAQRRPLRPALAALLPLHVADPALPRPDLPPRAARRDRGGGGRRRPPRRWRARASGARRASATRRRSSARPTTSRAASCSRPSCSGAAGSTEWPGEVIGVIGAGAFVAFGDGHEGLLPVRRLRGDWWELDPLEVMLVGGAVGQGDPARRPGRRSRSCASTRRAGAPTSPP